ncbi:PLP-dependent aminotransferase family protein [Pelagicoccus albus]|uniref:PLP-dependent aminotransferase family protein n=1 Tax=Pelagicoccus albus TaxID=415222 RepID=A0A7X1B6B3_9BACT|nr:PLP-dependent aminotransferase family protein [Pelagicoccus albus]MBC2606174.1 PLP-dependent aminotransferase family protein [Pelagicoccus albus]
MNSLECPKASLARRLNNFSGSVARDILSRTQNKEIISFAGGLPDASLWEDLVLPTVPPAAYQYGPSEGEMPLRQIMADRASAFGLDAEASRTLITSGSQQGLDLAAKLVIEPGTPVLVEAPTYLAALQVFQLFEADIQSLPLDTEGIDAAVLDRYLEQTKAPLAYLNPSFQNPSGCCYSLERRREIAEVLDRHATILLEDDPYRDLSYESDAPPPIASFLKNTPWIYLSSVSKTLIPGLRLGSLICSEELFPSLLKLKQAADLHSNRPAQFIATELLSDAQKNAERIEKLRSHYQQKRDLMESTLRADFKSLADWKKPSGGMFFWLTLKDRVDLSETLEECLKQNVAFMPGSPFFAHKNDHPCCIRLNFSLVSREKLENGTRVISRVIKSQSGYYSK